MNIKVLLSIFLLLIAQHANAATHQFSVTEKSFLETIKIVENYLLTKNYEINQTNDKILEIYFDTPELTYLKQNRYIKYEAIAYLSKKKKKTKYRETIEYLSDDNKSYTFPVKHYNNVKTFEEKHPLLSLVKRKERQAFLDKLKTDGVKYPMRLKEIVQVSKLMHTFDIYTNNHKIGSIHISKLKTSALDNEIEFILSDIALINNQKLVKNLRNLLGVTDKKTIPNEYIVVYQQMEENVGLYYWILRYPYLINLLYAIGFSLLGLLIIFGLFGKRLRLKS
ncbi:MAG: hypothetical protein KAH72_11635 [Flavobacteriaceae bacterium]|nr:hypothetical protein [Flavobacteriaceae bacterium]